MLTLIEHFSVVYVSSSQLWNYLPCYSKFLNDFTHVNDINNLKSLCCFSNFVIFIYKYLPKFNIERCSVIFIEIITWFTAGHYHHGSRFIEIWHESDENVVESSQIEDACRLKHYRWVNKHAMSRKGRLKHIPWDRKLSVNHCLHFGEIFIIFFPLIFKIQETGIIQLIH